MKVGPFLDAFQNNFIKIFDLSFPKKRVNYWPQTCVKQRCKLLWQMANSPLNQLQITNESYLPDRSKQTTAWIKTATEVLPKNCTKQSGKCQLYQQCQTIKPWILTSSELTKSNAENRIIGINNGTRPIMQHTENKTITLIN